MATEYPSAKVGSDRTRPGPIRGWGFALVAIFALLTLVAAWGVSVTYRGFTESALARRAALAQLGAATLSEKFGGVLQLGTSLATRVRFRVHLEAGDWTRAARILDEVPAHFAFARRIDLIDPQGVRRAFAPQGAYAEAAEGYGFRIDPCAPADPQKKGIVEAGVKYVKRNFLPTRSFRDLADLNAQGRRWVMEAAGGRIHGTTRGERPLGRFGEKRPVLQNPW